MQARCLVLCMVLVHCAVAEMPVNIPDPLLKQAIEDELQVYDPTPTDMLGLTSLSRIGTFATYADGIKDLTGLEFAVNLESLNLRLNAIVDTTPISEISKLQTINLSRNKISDLTPLSGLVATTHLNIHDNLIHDLAPLSSLVNLTFLDLHINSLTSLDGLSELVNLTTLILFRNSISDISGIASLVNLEILEMSTNHVSSLDALAGLTHLKELDLYDNHVQNVSILSDLSTLTSLDLSRNWISDISPLLELNNLTSLDLEYLNLNNDAYRYDLGELAGAVKRLVYSGNTNPPAQFHVAQGSHPNRIDIQWSPIPNGPFYTSYYRVLRSYSETEPFSPISSWQSITEFNDTTALPGKEYTYRLQIATNPDGLDYRNLLVSNRGWLAGPTITPPLHVDVNADFSGREDGSLTSPFYSMQAAIDEAAPGTTVVVWPGVYHEQILFRGKAITVTGISPLASTEIEAFPVIEPNGMGSAACFCQHEDVNSVLTGFIIRQGSDSLASAIYCNNSSPTIRNCLIVGNHHQETAALQGTIVCIDSQARFVNCTIANNQGYGLYLDNSPVSLVNSILWHNEPNDIYSTNESHPLVTYCNLSKLSHGDTNLSMEPLFVQSGVWSQGVWIPGDYHLMSQAGHWDPINKQWINGTLTSPLIDQGDPNTPMQGELTPDGFIVNLGAYGGTRQASKSVVVIE